jgi:uncharacterized protein
MRVEVFAELQALDQQLARLVHERDTLLGGFSERDRLRDLRESRRAISSTLKSERAHNTDLHWELEEIEIRLSTLEDTEREGPSDPLVARELTQLRARRAQLEEHVLRQMERVAELEAQLQAVEQEVEVAAAAWAEREPQLQVDLEIAGHVLESLQAERERVATRLTPDALALYDDLQRRHRGTSIAPVRNRQCGACRARLPGAVFDMLAAPDPLVRCPRCGRVLQPPSEPAK